jgi:hypothetical protein
VGYRFDHAVFAVGDLDAAAARWWDAYGLASIPGGHHPRWGTANRIVPLGADYLELLCPVDAEVALGSDLGRRLLDLIAEGDRWFAVCLADDDLDVTAARLDLAVEAGERAKPDGSVIHWRSAGLDDAQRDASLPFFIEWQVPRNQHPGRTPINHRVKVRGIASAEVTGSEARLSNWLAEAKVDIRVSEGPAEIQAVALGSPDGEPLLVS